MKHLLQNNTPLVVWLFAVCICFSHLAQGHLAVDAVRYAYIAKNILLSNNWIDLTDEFTNQPYHNKPHLLFWLLALSFKLFGYSTFTAKLPSAIFVCLAIGTIWKVVERHFSVPAAYWATCLFIANRVFMRDVLDLNFEGLAVLGSLLILNLGLSVSSKREPQFSDWCFAGIGMILLFQSKPPYLLLTLGPTILILFYEKQSRLSHYARTLIKGILPAAIFIALSILYLGKEYFSKSLTNQVLTPMLILSDYPENLKRWAFVFALSYAPISYIAAAFLIKNFPSLKRFSLLSRPTKFLLFWSLPALLIPFFIDCRPRYLIIPMLAVIVLCSKKLADFLPKIQEIHFQTVLLAFGSLSVIVFSLLNVKVHREDSLLSGYIEYRKNHPSLSPLLCLDGAFEEESKRLGRFSELLIALETEERVTVHSSSKLLQSTVSTENEIIAEKTCAAALLAKSQVFIKTGGHQKSVFIKTKP